ncbi:response regulator [Geodermatophilus obscurus]|uniref:Response regulator receiver protein n=1 Tax=Geodermatophilus obscurus (strain ATCC 25078 / DSM 43160 / JCM 3152 / CCUG 61914 / KCC A-0152 / KCTC 9177 / NBRC 13315 / NRRL B-3577 / G-20) TaxID=526225 RepID=D2SAE6_GEOOG|nr:response regulator transcription factor [Geodermatophilus obscurus]ADB73875.1 response regulator receiver protein [Geodermatophilus obscurus DSM 43160]
MITVLVADDHAFVRDSLVELFTASGDLTVVAECEDGGQVLDAARRTRPDVVLLDLAMPRVTGLQAARELLADRPESRVVVLTGSLTPALVREAREIGVVGYLLKGEDPGALPGHVRTVAAGGTAWSDAAASATAGDGRRGS